MIYRRITQNFLDQDWSTVIIELLVLIVGVFMGIQVANWNDDRLDAMKSQAYLDRIYSDLQADIESYTNRGQFWEKVSNYGKTGLEYSLTGDYGNNTAWDLLLAYFQGSQVAEFFTSRATYEELESNGELGLIPGIELRNQLVLYYTNADNPVLSERPVYRERTRGIIPLNIQRYIWENCWTANVAAEQDLIDCESPIPLDEAAEIVNRISSDAELMADLRYWMSTLRVGMYIVRDRISYANIISKMIKESASAK